MGEGSERGAASGPAYAASLGMLAETISMAAHQHHGEQPYSMTTRGKFLAIALSTFIIAAAPAYAESQQDCLNNMKPNTAIAGGVVVGGTVGTGVGIGAGVVACSTALLWAFLDLGLSYAACVTTVAGVGTALGGAVGTSVAEDKIIQEKKRCMMLPSEASGGTQRRYAETQLPESSK